MKLFDRLLLRVGLRQWKTPEVTGRFQTIYSGEGRDAIYALIHLEAVLPSEDGPQIVCPHCERMAGSAIFHHKGYRWSELTLHLMVTHNKRMDPGFLSMVASEAKKAK